MEPNTVTVTVTATMAAPFVELGLQIYEYSGIDTANPFISSPSTANALTGGGYTPATGSVTPTTAPALILAGLDLLAPGPSGSSYSLFSSGFTKRNDFPAGSALDHWVAGGDLIPSSIGSYTTSATFSSPYIAGKWLGLIAAFRAANPTAACFPSFSSTSQAFTAAGGTANLLVTSPGSCSWSAQSNAAWVNLLSGQEGTGTGAVSFSVAPNPDSVSRSTTITIGEQSFTVLQGAKFRDVAGDHPFYLEIGKLSARGITTGCGGGFFCPEAQVTREQAAVLIERALGEFSPRTPQQQTFADVGPGRWSYAFIEDLTQRSITNGCGVGSFCPEGVVTRGQMAAFLVRAFKL